MKNEFYAKTKWQRVVEHLADSEEKVIRMAFSDKKEATSRRNAIASYITRTKRNGTYKVQLKGNEVYVMRM